MRKCFNIIDTDLGGSIEYEELEKMFGIDKSDDKKATILKDMINDIDIDGNGEIEFEEF